MWIISNGFSRVQEKLHAALLVSGKLIASSWFLGHQVMSPQPRGSPPVSRVCLPVVQSLLAHATEEWVLLPMGAIGFLYYQCTQTIGCLNWWKRRTAYLKVTFFFFFLLNMSQYKYTQDTQVLIQLSESNTDFVFLLKAQINYSHFKIYQGFLNYETQTHNVNSTLRFQI